MPGSPVTTSIRGSPADTASSAAFKRSSSTVRPTIAPATGACGADMAPILRWRSGATRRSPPCTTSAAGATQARIALDAEGVLVDLFGDDDVELDGELTLALEPYGARWFRLRRPGQRIAP